MDDPGYFDARKGSIFTTSFSITNFFLIFFVPGRLVYYIYPGYMEDEIVDLK